MNFNRKIFVLTLVVFLALSSVTWGAVFSVYDVTSFQNALTMAEDNGEDDIINIGDGTYYVTTTLTYNATEDYKLSILGVGIGSTTLDGGGSVRILDIDANADIFVSGITFRNANSSGMGGGLAISQGYAGVIVQDSEFNNNSVSSFGGGAYVFSPVGADITFTNNTFSGNIAAKGGGVNASGGTVAFTDNTFIDNAAVAPAIFNTGGGVNASGETVTFTNNIFNNNTANGKGGGIDVSTNSGTVTLANNSFTNNTTIDSVASGGGAYVFSDTGTIILTDNRFSGNTAPAINSSGGGCYAHTISGTVTFTSNTFSDNSAYTAGGGAAGSTSAGTVTLTNNLFTDNTATSIASMGGGAYAYTETGIITLAKNKLASNSASMGGGVYTLIYSSGEVVFSNNIFNENEGSVLSGGAAYFLTGDDGIITFTNNTVTDNTAQNNGGIYFALRSDFARADIYNNIIWNNSTPFTPFTAGDDLYIESDIDGNGIGSIVNLFNNDFSDFYISYGDNLSQGDNINASPLFVGTASGDYRLQEGSHVIDMGNNNAPELLTTDIDGNPRFIGVAVDMGAYEYQGGYQGNNPPSIPQLVYPANGQKELGTTVEFRWEKSTDLDLDALTYFLYYSENADFIGSTPIQVAYLGNKNFYYAGTGMGFLLFGIAFAGGVRGKKQIALLFALIIIAAMLTVSCGSGDDGGNGGGDNGSGNSNEVTQTVSGLSTGTTYYWKVIVDDGNGGIIESEVSIFSIQ